MGWVGWVGGWVDGRLYVPMVSMSQARFKGESWARIQWRMSRERREGKGHKEVRKRRPRLPFRCLGRTVRTLLLVAVSKEGLGDGVARLGGRLRGSGGRREEEEEVAAAAWAKGILRVVAVVSRCCCTGGGRT